MDESILKLECLKLSHTGSPDISIKIAQQYFNWIIDRQPEEQLNDHSKRSRKFKQK